MGVLKNLSLSKHLSHSLFFESFEGVKGELFQKLPLAYP